MLLEKKKKKKSYTGSFSDIFLQKDNKVREIFSLGFYGNCAFLNRHNLAVSVHNRVFEVLLVSIVLVLSSVRQSSDKLGIISGRLSICG